MEIKAGRKNSGIHQRYLWLVRQSGAPPSDVVEINFKITATSQLQIISNALNLTTRLAALLL
jgi:hypothetical protein